MKYLNLKYCYFSIALFLAMLNPLYSQVPDFSKVLNLDEGDSANIVHLINNGVQISKGRVICWFPKDSLSPKQMQEIAGMLNKGISGAEKFINAPLSWQSHLINIPYTFYFRFDNFISHASGVGFVSIPFWRIKEGKAPWLHEAMHEMLLTNTGSWMGNSVPEKEWSEKMPLWLYEGLPEYITAKVSSKNKLLKFDPFTGRNLTDADSLFIEEVKSDKGKYVIAFIGSKGVLPELFSEERKVYAGVFYHGSHSFVKYIAETYDVKFLLSGISSFGKEHEVIEKMTGKSLEILKKEWLDKLKIAK